VPLLLVGLDNTLIDRIGAFRTWARGFLDEIRAPEYDLDWLLSIDADGQASAWDIAEAVKERYRLHASVFDIVAVIREGVLANIRLDPLVACALTIAGEAGYLPVVVTNGETVDQEAKLARTGLDRYVADWVISEQVGVRKPNPRIFMMAAERMRMRLHGAWVVGDDPAADIGGAVELGTPSVWLHRGRHWRDHRFGPTRTAENIIGAVAAVLAR
jgi:putative hydrolase of the HAD superfamily